MSTDLNVVPPVLDVSAEPTAAERILAEKKISGGYRFAPGITIHAPSKRSAERIATLMEGVDAENPSEDDIALVFQALLGDQYLAVMDYLDDFPVEGYPELFADLFENLLKLIPHERDVAEFMGEAETRWKAIRPELFEAEAK